LGRGGFGEVWKCEAPGGLHKAIKFVRGAQLGDSSDGAQQELRALQLIKTIRHPFLLSTERIEEIDGDLVIVMELADKSLHDLFQERRRKGSPGIPRPDLLGYFREAAEVLDLMNQEHGLQHLDVKPRNLFLIGRHVKVADFGQVNSLADLLGDQSGKLGGVTPLYAAPEVFYDQVTLFTDQYSLAVSYQELLTGTFPFSGKSYRQLALMVTSQVPDLAALPEYDRPVLARALAREPRQRFPSCLEFVEALEAATPPGEPRGPRPRTTSVEIRLPDMARTTVLPDLSERATAPIDPPRQATPTASLRPARPAGKPEAPAREESAAPAREADEPGPLAGYELLECLGRGPAGEAWRARGPDRKPRQVRFLVPPAADALSKQAPLARLCALEHDSLAALQVIPTGADRVALVSEDGELNLAARFKECQAEELPGIPRDELLNLLGQAAIALDELRERYQLQHLCLSPRHLAVAAGHPILLDFGLAELVWLPAGLQPALLNPRYAAVELLTGTPTDAADQYSLALIYQELLCGLHPFRHLGARQLGNPRFRSEPDLALLPAADRAALLRALHPDPARRHRGCAGLIAALRSVSGEWRVASEERRSSSPTTHHSLSHSSESTVIPVWQPLVHELFIGRSTASEVRSCGPLHYRYEPGHTVEHHARARLVPGTAKLKLGGFAEHWQADVLARSATGYRLVVRTPGNLFQRVLGRAPGVEVDVRLRPAFDGGLTLIRVTIVPVDCSPARRTALLEELTPGLLGSLQTFLNTTCDRAAQEWYPLAGSVQVSPADGRAGPMTATACAIGRHGLTLALPSQPGAELRVRLPRPGQPPFEVPLRVLWCQEVKGGYEVEGRFGA
jgi:serine/threonine protein kinase